ncbi:unnamed protein product [Urochloa humidicola]
MRRKKHLDRGGGGGGGTELFICFTSRPSAASATSVAAGGAPSSLRPSNSSKLLSPGRASAGAGAEAAPGPPLHPSLSRRLRNSGSLKGGQSPMFPSGSTGGGRRGRGGFEPAEPSSPKVTCIGQVRVKGGKRKAKHASAAALRSRSRRGGVGGGAGSAEASFRRAGDDRDGPQGKNQGWVYQIPVNICEALKTFGSCGGRSLCSPSRPGGAGERGVLSADAHGGKKRRQRAPAGGSWLCAAAVARCLLAIQEEEDDEVGKGAAVVPAEEMRASEVGLVMEGWDVEEEEKAVMVGEVEVEKKDEILVVGKEEEGRVSVCIPPRNALLLMRCRSDPVRMAALATRFWGSPAAATVEQVDNEVAAGVDNNEEEDDEEDEDEDETEECKDEARHSAVSVKDVNCGECGGGGENDGDEAGEIDQAQAEAEESSKCGDLVEDEKDGSCGAEVEEAQIVRKDAALEVSLGEDTATDNQGPGMVELVVSKEEEDAPAQGKVEEEVKGRRSISNYSPSAALKEDRNKLRRLSSRRRVSTSSRASSASDRAGRRHSFSAETEARRSSFSGLKDSRRASFSIDRDGRRWSFSIEQEHLVAEPKVLMASRKGKKASSEQESEKDCAVIVAPNSAEEGQESYEDGKEEETTKNGEEGDTQDDAETKQEVQKVENRAEGGEAGPVVPRRKKSGELPDCLLLMMYEPKLSMEVSKETWVCSTDFVHWKSYQGKNNRNRHPQKASASGDDAAIATVEPKDKENAEGSTVANDAQDSKDPSTVNLPAAPMPPPIVQKTPPPKAAATEQKMKLDLPLVANAAAYAPFVLKRCKSEPMRSSARLAPDACFWKDRHRPLNATGVGF